MVVPMTLNGYTGSKCHVPFPVLARAYFGYQFAEFAVILSLITAMFWHLITNYLAVGPATQVISAVFPSFRTMTNHLPASAGVTSQAVIAYFVLWTIQFPLLLIPVHKMKWLFMTKTIMMTITVFGMLIWIRVKARGSGERH
jgi:NCS1 family nucleobase:cation symporter-1